MLGGEQIEAAGSASVHAFLLVIHVRTGKRGLRPLLPEHFVLLRSQTFPPVRFVFMFEVIHTLSIANR